MKDEFVLEVLNPRSIRKTLPAQGLTAPRPSTLNKKRVAIIPDKPDSDVFLDMLEQLLYEEYPEASISRVLVDAFAKPEQSVEQILGKYDVWIEGVKTAGHWEIDRMAPLEKAGIPGVTIVVDEYILQRKRLAEASGLPGLRIATVNTDKFMTNGASPKKNMEIAREALDGVIHALTDPISEEEAHPTPFRYDYSNLLFTGKGFSEANEKFQTYFSENEMGDGLALIPPTKEAVEQMLTGTSRDPQEVLGLLEPCYGVVTIEKVAINAVMAGAKPEYLPVIIAAIEGLADPDFDEYHIQVCHIGSGALIVVNGPIAKEIGMNCKSGFLNPGTRANSSIGRAVSLCLINIGWAFYKTEHCFAGTANRYCNTIFCENEEDSPWESFAVEQGYSPDDNIVTIDETLGTMTGPAGTMYAQPLEEDIQKLANMLGTWAKTDTMPQLNLKTGVNTLVIYPSLARQLADAGYTREKLKTELINRRRIPWDTLGASAKRGYLQLAEEGKIPLLTTDDCQTGRTVPLFNRNRLRLFVVGPMAGMCVRYFSYGNYKSSMRGYDYNSYPFNIKKIHGATLTKAGK